MIDITYHKEDPAIIFESDKKKWWLSFEHCKGTMYIGDYGVDDRFVCETGFEVYFSRQSKDYAVLIWDELMNDGLTLYKEEILPDSIISGSHPYSVSISGGFVVPNILSAIDPTVWCVNDEVRDLKRQVEELTKLILKEK